MKSKEELRALLEANELTHCSRYIFARNIVLKIFPAPKKPTEEYIRIFLSFYKQILRMNESAIRKFQTYLEC